MGPRSSPTPGPGSQSWLPLWRHRTIFTGKGRWGTTREGRNTFRSKESPQTQVWGPRRGKFCSLAWNKNRGQAGGSQLAEVGPGTRPLGGTNDDVPEAFHGLQLVALKVHHELVAAHVEWQQVHPHLGVLPRLHGVRAVEGTSKRVRTGGGPGLVPVAGSGQG